MGLAGRYLGISKSAARERMLVQHFMQHHDTARTPAGWRSFNTWGDPQSCRICHRGWKRDGRADAERPAAGRVAARLRARLVLLFQPTRGPAPNSPRRTPGRLGSRWTMGKRLDVRVDAAASRRWKFIPLKASERWLVQHRHGAAACRERLVRLPEKSSSPSPSMAPCYGPARYEIYGRTGRWHAAPRRLGRGQSPRNGARWPGNVRPDACLRRGMGPYRISVACPPDHEGTLRWPATAWRLAAIAIALVVAAAILTAISVDRRGREFFQDGKDIRWSRSTGSRRRCGRKCRRDRPLYGTGLLRDAPRPGDARLLAMKKTARDTTGSDRTRGWSTARAPSPSGAPTARASPHRRGRLHLDRLEQWRGAELVATVRAEVIGPRRARRGPASIARGFA